MSNLLDKASIILTPTAYNNGEALCVKPSDGSGDFDFSRNSAATRVNAQGLVENVQILSSNLVQNGDFSEEGAEEVSNGSFSQEGAEQITNGNFSVDGTLTTSSYTLGWYSPDSGLSISDGKLIITNSASLGGRAYGTNGVNSISFLTSGKSYKLVYTIEENNDNALVNYHNGGAYVTAPNTVGTHTIYYQAAGAIFILRNSTENTTIKIDNVSVREVGDWILGTNWSIGEDKAISDGTSGNLYQSGIIVTGKQYKIQATVSDYVSGNVQVSAGAVPRGTMSANGTYTFYQTASSTSTFFLISNIFNGSITNISVKEVAQNWDLQSGWSIGENKAISDAQGYIIQTDVGGAGVTATYKIQWEQNITAGTRLRFFARNYNDGGNATILSITRDDGVSISGGNCIGSGTFTAYVSSTNGYSFKLLAEAGVEADITNITTIQITTDTNLPRINYEGFSYDGSGNVVPDSGCGSWLWEPQSTNLLPYSSDFSQWSVVNASLNANETISPDGTQNASKLNATSVSSRIQQSLSFSGVNTISIFVKYAGDDVTVRFERNTSNDRCSFDVSSLGVVFNSAETGIIDYNVEEFSNDWYRISCSYDGGNYFQFNWDITGNNGSVYIWGAQAENLSYASSLIPTEGSTVTRNQDVCTNGGSLASINSTSGTLYFEGKRLSLLGSKRTISISDGSLNNYLYIQFQGVSNTVRIFYKTVENGQVLLLNHALTSPIEFGKYAFKWSDANFSLWVNGVKELEQLTGNTATSNVFNTIGFSLGNAADKFFGKTKAVAVWKEALSDEEITELTTI